MADGRFDDLSLASRYQVLCISICCLDALFFSQDNVYVSHGLTKGHIFLALLDTRMQMTRGVAAHLGSMRPTFQVPAA